MTHGTCGCVVNSPSIRTCDESVVLFDITESFNLIRECLETHDDRTNLLYLTDIETTLQDIHKWIGGGTKLNLSRSPDEGVL